MSLNVHVKELTNVDNSCTFLYAKANIFKYIDVSINLEQKIISSNKKKVELSAKARCIL